MTALTTAQLDELERKAKAAETPGPWQWSRDDGALESTVGHAVVLGASPCGDHNSDVYGCAGDKIHIAANSPDTTLRLVAIARAALAWRDARLARQGVQTRAGLAETSAEYHAAMSEMPAAKEADVLACLNLMSALGPP